MLFDSVAFRTSFGLKNWLLTLIKQFTAVRHLTFELVVVPPKFDRDTASVTHDPYPSNESVPAHGVLLNNLKSPPSWP